jgi:hypothetical protein
MTAKVEQSTPVTSPFVDYDEWLVPFTPGLNNEAPTSSAFFDTIPSESSFAETVDASIDTFSSPANRDFAEHASGFLQEWSKAIATNQSQFLQNFSAAPTAPTSYHNGALSLNINHAIQSSGSSATALPSSLHSGHFFLTTVPSTPQSNSHPSRHDRDHSISTVSSGLSPYATSAAPSPLEATFLTTSTSTSPEPGLASAVAPKRKRNKDDTVCSSNNQRI